MSSIRWHFSGPVEKTGCMKSSRENVLCMGGRERAWFSLMVDNITESLVEIVLPYEESLKLKRPLMFRRGGDCDLFEEKINTVLVLGSPSLRLAALIHAQCEINAVIEPGAMPEIADALEYGLQEGVFRKEIQNYDPVEDIIRALRSGHEWCAWSYSVTDGFPRWKPEVEVDGEYESDMYTEEETVELLRSQGLTLEKGCLTNKPVLFGEGEHMFNMSKEKLINGLWI